MVGASKAALDGQSLVAGYVWFTTNDGKFYIDWEDKHKVLHRSVLNAGHADTAGHADSADTASTAVSATSAGSAVKAEQDSGGNVITSTYLTNTNAANTYATISTVNGKAPTNHASSANTYGVGSTSNYGHIKIGSNIGVTDGVISLSKANVTAALGYTPPTSDTNTTYTFATGDNNGQIKVTPSGGSAQNISVKGLGSAAYKDASGSWGISITGSSASCTGNAATATKATQDSDGNAINSTYLKLSGGTMSGRLTLGTSVTDHTTPMTQILCVTCSAVPSGTTLTDKNAPGIGFHISDNSWGSLILNSGAFKFINNDATSYMPVYASSFVGSGESLTSLNAGNISSGTLAVARGGTGLTTAPSLQVNLGSTSAASIFAASPRPGVTGTLAIGNGGTGATTAAGARTNLSACGYTTVSSLSIADFTSTAYLPLTGGTLSGQLTLQAALSGTTATFSGNVTAATVNGAVWNDYAEYRAIDASAPAGYCVVEKGNDELTVSTRRLEPAAYIVSDTFGFSIGKTAKARCPVAVAGRVLAYPFEDRDSYKPGDPVCAAPGGRVSKMTRKEAASFPDRIIGIVSAIPDYETWGENEVKVNGRIWIKVK